MEGPEEEQWQGFIYMCVCSREVRKYEKQTGRKMVDGTKIRNRQIFKKVTESDEKGLFIEGEDKEEWDGFICCIHEQEENIPNRCIMEDNLYKCMDEWKHKLEMERKQKGEDKEQ